MPNWRQILQSVGHAAENPAVDHALVEGGEDVLKMMGRSGQADNAYFAEQQAQKALQERAAKAAQLESTFGGTQNVVDDATGVASVPKPANESAEVFSQVPEAPTQQLGDDVLPNEPIRVNEPRDPLDSGMDDLNNQFLPDSIPTKEKVSLSKLQQLGLASGAAGLGTLGYMAAKSSKSAKGRAPAVDGSETRRMSSPEEESIYQNYSGMGTSENPSVHKAEYVSPEELSTEAKKTSGVKPIASEVKGTAKSSDTNTLDSIPFTASINTVENLAAAQRAKADGEFVNRMGRAGEMIGAGIAGQGAKPTSTAMFDEQIKAAGDSVTNFEQQAEKEKDDPKSEVSYQFRDFVKKFGVTLPPNTSANSAAKIMPYAYQKFAASEAQKARAFESEENRKARTELARERNDTARTLASEKREKAHDEKTFGRVQGLRKELDKQTSTFQNIYDQRQSLKQLLNEAIADGGKNGKGGFSDIAYTYSFIKGRDDSAVREGEINILRNAGSVPDRIRRTLGQALRGKAYNVTDMQELAGLLDRENKQLVKTYKDRADTIVKQGEAYGLPRDEIISRSDMYNDALASESKAQTSERSPDAAAPTPASNEVERKAKDGRMAIFNADTKAFIRFK